MVQTVWTELPAHYPGVAIDDFVVMPNHVHGILVLTSDDPDGDAIELAGGRPAPHRATTGGCPYDQVVDPMAVGAAPRGRPGARQPVGAGPRACPGNAGRSHAEGQPRGFADLEEGQPRGVAPTMSLPDIVHRFKTMTTKRYADGVKQAGWAPFPGRLWQRNYYEHIIRNDESMHRLRQYIADNPARWQEDTENLTETRKNAP
jgi:putative transposase